MFKVFAFVLLFAVATANVTWREGTPDSRCTVPNPEFPIMLPGPTCTSFYKCNSGYRCKLSSSIYWISLKKSFLKSHSTAPMACTSTQRKVFVIVLKLPAAKDWTADSYWAWLCPVDTKLMMNWKIKFNKLSHLQVNDEVFMWKFCEWKQVVGVKVMAPRVWIILFVWW